MSKQEQNRQDGLRLLAQFLDGDLSPAEEKEALCLIAEDDELRGMLRFDRFLADSLRGELGADSFSVPEGFTDCVMSRIHEMEESPDQVSWFDRLMVTVNGWFTPQEYQFRPAMVFAVPAILLIAFAGLFQTVTEQEKPVSEVTTSTEFVADGRSDEVWIRFIYIDEDAEKMEVAGNFNDWNPVEMTSQVMNGKTVWTGLVPVERGEHHYMFVKDGEEWISDPLAEVQRDDGFGNKNAVIYL